MRLDIPVEDLKVDDEVSHMLRVHVEIDTTGIQLEVERGEVALLGSVPEDEMRLAAELLVARAPGVKKVSNFLDIKYAETIFP